MNALGINWGFLLVQAVNVTIVSSLLIISVLVAARYLNERQPPKDPERVLTKLKKLLDSGLITTQEFEATKAEILARM